MLVDIVNRYIRNKSYTVKKRRIKLFKKEVVIKTIIVCNTYDKIVFIDSDIRNISSKRKKYFFEYNIKLKNK